MSSPNSARNSSEINPDRAAATFAGKSLSRRALVSHALIAAGTVALVMAAVRPVRAALIAASPSRAKGVTTVASPAALANAMNTDSVGAAETEVGNIVADAVRMAAAADIAFVPASAFRTSVSVARPVPGNQAAGLIEPGDEAVVVLALSGEKIKSALERAVALRPQASDQFLQVSNVRFTYDEGRRSGHRVTSVTVNDAPLDSARTYRVAMTRALAKGQHGYFRIWEKVEAQDTGKTLAQSLRDLSAARGGALSAPPEGRISPAR
jgi:2',3'-cyclic-nucleotide 2'-phosphodiesterase (5'-nucleotidase family)